MPFTPLEALTLYLGARPRVATADLLVPLFDKMLRDEKNLSFTVGGRYMRLCIGERDLETDAALGDWILPPSHELIRLLRENYPDWEITSYYSSVSNQTIYQFRLDLVSASLQMQEQQQTERE